MRAWFAGDFEGCLASCDRVRPNGVETVSQLALLRARALLRLGRPQDAVAVVNGVFIAHGTLDASLTARMLLGQAYVRLDEHERGLAMLEQAYRAASDAHPTIRSEIALNIGLAYYGLRKLDEAEAALDLVVEDADIVHARALEYRAWVAAARVDTGAAPQYFARARARAPRVGGGRPRRSCARDAIFRGRAAAPGLVPPLRPLLGSDRDARLVDPRVGAARPPSLAVRRAARRAVRLERRRLGPAPIQHRRGRVRDLRSRRQDPGSAARHA